MRLQASWVLLLGLILTASAAQAAGGLLLNSDFATADPAQQRGAANWATTAPKLYQMVDDDGHRDSFSLHYQAAQAGPGGSVTQKLKVSQNTDYVLTAALKSDGTLKPVVRVYAPAQEAVVVSLMSDGSRTWKVFSTRFNSGAAEQLAVQLFGDQALVRGTEAVVGHSALDDVQIYPASQAPAELRPANVFTPPGPNVALGKPYTLQPAPSYGYCTDPDDRIQLTDGEYTVGYFWTQKTTVGWNNANPVIITLDLGKLTAIAGMSLNTAGGRAGVAWPTSIMILVSDDGKEWTTAGDLVALGTQQGVPDSETYAVFRFATDQLKTRGRFVKLFVDNAPYTFMDEIEVYEGPAALLAQAPEGERVSDALTLYNSRRVHNGLMWRLRADLEEARQAINSSRLPAAQKQALLDRANDIAAEFANLLPRDVPADFKTILPLNAIHTRLYALYGPLHRAAGLAPLTAWASGRWDPLAPTARPEKAPPAPPALRVDTMLGETRAAAFNLTNAGERPLRLTVSVTGLPGGINPTYLKVHEVLHTDTRERKPIAAALPEATAAGGGYRITIPAGMTRQVWLAFKPTTVAPGIHQGQVAVQGGPAPLRLPLTLRVSALQFPAQPDIHVGGWDYVQGKGNYEANPDNIPALMKMLTEHYVDTPWGSGSVQPNGVKFDDAGALTAIAFDGWNEWIGKWPGARLYAAFLSVGKAFHGEPMGTPRFNRMVGEWITAWVKHLETQRLKPEQLVLLLVDEPHNDDMAEQITHWARAINAAQPKVTLFEDPTFSDPRPVKPEFWTELDIICPNLPMFISRGQDFRDFYTGLQKGGQELWFYSCSGPSKLLDPITYHRIQFWFAARHGAKGSFYWAFGDEAGASSWNAYLQKRFQYSPLFLSPDSVTLAKHMAAIGEGVQDYQYFVMLRQRVAELQQKGVRSPLVAQAEALLTAGPDRVIATVTPANQTWSEPKDREVMDQVRVEVLELLEKLAKL